MENGARDEWGDLFGNLARVYICDDNIGALFKRHGFSLNYNYKTKNFDPEIAATNTDLKPAKRGKFALPTTREETATTTTTEPQPGLCRTVSLESSAEQQLSPPRSTSSSQDPHSSC